MVLNKSNVCTCEACHNRNLWIDSNLLSLMVQMVLEPEACQHTDT